MGDLLEGAGACRGGAAGGRRARDERRRGFGRAQVETGAAPASARSPIVSKPLIPAAKNCVAERASRGRGTVCRGGVIISVHTCRDESLTKNLSRSAPRLTGRPRVELRLLLHAGRTRFTRKASARERWEGGRAAEGASVSVRACRCLCREEGAHAQFSCKKVAALNHAPSVAT